MRKLLHILLPLCLLTACQGGSGERKKTLGKTVSQPYELLLVADKSWMSTAQGRQLLTILNERIPGLNQPEANFRITNINETAFDGTFKYYASILTIKTGKDIDKPELLIARNPYARQQLMLTLQAPDEADIVEYAELHSQQIMELLVENELEREEAVLNSKHSGKMLTAVKRMFGYQIHAPEDVNNLKEGRNFIWGTSDGRLNELNVCVYSLPITTSLTPDALVAARDSVMAINILGNRDGQHMATDPEGIIVKERKLNGHVITEMRGLWAMENDMMGGPFVSFFYPDSTSRRTLVAEGFVYKPNKNKRNLIRELEAALRTFSAWN